MFAESTLVAKPCNDGGAILWLSDVFEMLCRAEVVDLSSTNSYASTLVTSSACAVEKFSIEVFDYY